MFYQFDQTKFLGSILREGLDELRSARYKLGRVLGDIQQMTDAQVAEQFGFVDEATAASAKAELQSDVGKLLTNTFVADQAYAQGQSINIATDAAITQMLNQFG